MAEFSIPISKWKVITEEDALDEEWDMIPALTTYQRTLSFCKDLENRRSQLERLISRHLGVPLSAFVPLSQSHWVWGSFNICFPIDIKSDTRTLPTQTIPRLPLPFTAGEEYSPGNIDEKLRCEAATYIWLRRHCPSIPTPRLLAMGFPGVQSFTAIEKESLWNRFIWCLRRSYTWFQGDHLSPFFAHNRGRELSDIGYLLLEYVVDGRMLSSSWQQHRKDERRCGNLYRSISNILLDLAKVPLPRIGSWTLDNRGVISLTSRPLLDLTVLWNRHEISTPVPKSMLAYQDARMQHQPNSILSRADGIYQLSALIALRALLLVFSDPSTQQGPFVLTLPDLHQSNIFVDEDWNIVSVIDLEFSSVQPIRMVNVPTWFSGRSVEQLTGPALDEYKVLYDRFIAIMQDEETARGQMDVLSAQLHDDWRTGRLWYHAALRSSNAFPLIFERNIRPRFFRNSTRTSTAPSSCSCGRKAARRSSLPKSKTPRATSSASVRSSRTRRLLRPKRVRLVEQSKGRSVFLGKARMTPTVQCHGSGDFTILYRSIPK
nr:hypothetical protein CFP56_69173 [Quercus suber]